MLPTTGKVERPGCNLLPHCLGITGHDQQVGVTVPPRPTARDRAIQHDRPDLVAQFGHRPLGELAAMIPHTLSRGDQALYGCDEPLHPVDEVLHRLLAKGRVDLVTTSLP